MKKVLSIVVAAVMLLTCALAGCAAQTASEPSASTEASAETSASASAEESASSEANAPEDVEMVPVDSEYARVDMVNKEPEKPLRLAFLSLQNNAFFDLVAQGAELGKQLMAEHNVTVDYIVMGDTMDAQTVNTAMDAAIVQQYDGIIVTPFSVGTEAYIDKAVDAGIPVITLYGESTEPSKRMLFIGQDAYSAGKIVGEYVADKYPEGGKYGIVTGVFGVEVFEGRNSGFKDGLAKNGAEWEEVGIMESGDSADKVYSITKDYLTANPDLKAVYVSSGGNYGASKAIEEKGLSDQVISAGHDEVPDNLEYVADGQMVVISQDTMGVAVSSLIYMYNYLVGGVEPESDVIPSNSFMIDKDNVSDYL